MLEQKHIDYIIKNLGGKITKLDLDEGWLHFTCRGLRGSFMHNESCDKLYYHNLLCIDRIDCFDKVGKCAIQVQFPSNKMEEKILDSYLKFIRLSASYHFSNNYQYIYNYNFDVTYYRDKLAKILSEVRDV